LCVLIGSFAMPALAGPQVQPQPEVQPQPWTPKPFALFPAPKPPDRPLGTKALPLFPQKAPDLFSQKAVMGPPERQAPSIVCGMTLIPGDPGIDPLIVRTQPPDGRFVIRALPPHVCVR
jgi:hypothetical protein